MLMAIYIIRRFSTTGKCPKTGCIEKDNSGKWRIISNKTGKYWPAYYRSKESAEAALSAYHANR